MIRAIQAAAISASANKINRIEDNITNAAKKGDYNISVDSKLLNNSDIELLREFGYQISKARIKRNSNFGMADDDEEIFDETFVISWSG